MKIIKIATLDKKEKEDKMDDMKDFFKFRTKKHIERVKKYASLIEKIDPPSFKGLIEQTSTHDDSKFEEPEYTPYLWITWDYKCKAENKKLEIPEDVREKMSLATEHHVKSNRHHPEFHSKKEVNLINREDRDKPPSEIIDATSMTNVDIAEMVADWLSMSEEKATNPNEWADKNINVRWKFTDRQEALIWILIGAIWIDVATLIEYVDKKMDEQYHYGLAKKGSFGYEANRASVCAAIDCYRNDIKDIDKVSDKIHQAWSEVAETFEDPVYKEKPQKRENRLKLAKIPYNELSEDEKDKDRLIAKSVIEYIERK